MTFDQGEQLCKDKGATMPVMESYPYAEDIAEFLGLHADAETSIWLGNQIHVLAFWTNTLTIKIYFK